jgi:hypothetical protein
MNSLSTVYSSLSCEQQNRFRVRLGRIDFEKKKFLRINLKVGDEQIRWGKLILRRRNLGKTNLMMKFGF